MPVMGPDYSRVRADEAFNKLLGILKDEYGIQRFPPDDILANWQKDRDERNQALRDAVHKLFELESWESF